MAEILHVDASNAVVGRLASFVAKQALLGRRVNVFNCEAAIISGNPQYTFDRYHHFIADTGQPFRGPYYPRLADRFVRRMIRGMVPFRQARGQEAFDRIMCYIGVPVKFKDVKLQKVGGADSAQLATVKRITIKDLIYKLGGRL
ncbi:50S ribosomal protein L13 [Candidatus Woesearchaeota archaeon]|nr:50S ribosomal protein L13 [Candidatus Woesearchaeota archaeon]